MTREDIRNRLNAIFRDVLDDDSIELSDATTANDIEPWDSMEHVRLMIAIESALHVRFTTQEINSPANIGELIDIIQGKLA